jgi:Ca2+-binding EF-hand superfamily protein
MKYVTFAFMTGALIATAADAQEAQKQRRDPQQIFSRMDANGDGRIELNEFLAKKTRSEERRMARFKKLDTNADGYITTEEFQTHAAKRGKRHSKPAE